MGRKEGITDDQLHDLAEFEHSPAFDDFEKNVLRYATAMTQTPVEIPDAVFTALQARLNEKQLVELTSAIAWENYRSRFDHAFGLESEGFAEGAACAVPVGAKH